MTKEEVIQAMHNEKKVTHKYFSSDEWISMKDGYIITEDDARCTPQEFWKWRTEVIWENDWELFNN